ncbi:MAG: hypothetical protein ACRC5R_03085, partial [Mycoplasmatales bacterium]
MAYPEKITHRANKNLPGTGYRNQLLKDLKLIKTNYVTLKTLEKIKELDCEKHKDLLRLLKDIEEFKNIYIINEWWSGEFKT